MKTFDKLILGIGPSRQGLQGCAGVSRPEDTSLGKLLCWKPTKSLGLARKKLARGGKQPNRNESKAAMPDRSSSQQASKQPRQVPGAGSRNRHGACCVQACEHLQNKALTGNAGVQAQNCHRTEHALGCLRYDGGNASTCRANPLA
jgi:hypothetical protein